MSPLDMLIFFFFILVTVKAGVSFVDYWREEDDEAAKVPAVAKRAVAPAPARTFQRVRPSSVRVTPIKRERIPAAAVAAQANRKIHNDLKNRGVA